MGHRIPTLPSTWKSLRGPLRSRHRPLGNPGHTLDREDFALTTQGGVNARCTHDPLPWAAMFNAFCVGEQSDEPERRIRSFLKQSSSSAAGLPLIRWATNVVDFLTSDVTIKGNGIAAVDGRANRMSTGNRVVEKSGRAALSWASPRPASGPR